MAEESTVEATEGEVENNKSGKLKLILIIVAVLLVGILGTVGAMLMLGGDEAAEDVNVEPAKPKQALYTKMRTLEGNPYFTVSIKSNDGRSHYLQVYLEAKSRDDLVVTALAKHMPRIVANLNRLFTAQSLSTLRTAAGKQVLQLAATQEIQAVLQEKIGRPGIETALFTGFIMQ